VRMRKIACQAAMMIFAATLLGSCARNNGAAKEIPPTPTQPVAAAPTEPVELRAAAFGNRVYIEVRNNSVAVLRVSPYHFGVIIKKQLVIFDPKTMVSQFPSAVLRKGETASGYLTFRQFKTLAGAKLVYNNPDYKPMMTMVQEVVGAPSEPAPQKNPETTE
jgi:hypothetical protein